MEMTNGELLNLSLAIAQAGRDGKEMRNLPWRLTYALARTTTAIKPLLEALEAGRKSIFEKHANGAESIKIDEPAGIAYDKEYGELLKLKVDAPVHRFRFADIEGTSLPPATLTALLPLIEEEPPKPAEAPKP